ncbi:hypothetical protein LJR164_001607 [Phenylobacterium sp. LjRoot164]|uniref:hypothetical protein n=1 Tax=unclassified Phenylobacterium TaxID=2640670 RepID=UPI003ED1691C
MFRFPSLNEVFSLFFRPTRVEHAIKSIEAAAVRADTVAVVNSVACSRAAAEVERLQARCAEEAAKADERSTEAARAARVATRLRELVA